MFLFTGVRCCPLKKCKACRLFHRLYTLSICDSVLSQFQKSVLQFYPALLQIQMLLHNHPADRIINGRPKKCQQTCSAHRPDRFVRISDRRIHEKSNCNRDQRNNLTHIIQTDSRRNPTRPFGTMEQLSDGASCKKQQQRIQASKNSHHCEKQEKDRVWYA